MSVTRSEPGAVAAPVGAADADARLVISGVSHDYVAKKERIHALDPVDMTIEPG